VKTLATRARSTIQALGVLRNSVRGFSLLRWKRIFQTVIVPVLTYGSQVWFTDHRQASLIGILQVAQNEACRKIGSFFCTTPTNLMHNLLSIPPIRYRLWHLIHQASLRLDRLPPFVSIRNPARTHGATGVLNHVECRAILPPSMYPAPPFDLPPHPSTPPWSNPRFIVHLKPKDKRGFGPSKGALRGTDPSIWKVWLMVTKAQASDRNLALYCVFQGDIPFMSDYTPIYSQGGLLLALSLALGRIPRNKDVLIFFQDGSFPLSFSSSESPYLRLATGAIDAYLENSPLCTITAFWASRSWAWAGQCPWWIALKEAEFHLTLDAVPQLTPSRARMFLEWATDWVPLNREDYRRHHCVVSDPPMDGLHPFVYGVLKKGSRRLQCAAFQVVTGHCFAGDYSAAFRPDSDDRTDCPDCRAFCSHTHILDTCSELRGARKTWLRHHSSYSIFSCEETGSYLVEFMYNTQRLLRPLEPPPLPIPPEPDP
jgi:hypothetical protein